ncbi:unnamed protein product [Schistocephalus solidus]|uniref:HECT domain-containing protein n=1 Tax=Schistocephalus solidus TaxID=70667 RepID=A0A183TBJ7_SCHSO|nr:unnamed protein product [Schistocephalus solidus]
MGAFRQRALASLVGVGFEATTEFFGDDEDSSITNVVQSAFGLREFTLLSPADPGVRRLVGTTRIRLLLSSIEMALAESKCALPMLVQYGCNSFYYGLSLKRPGEMETETEGATGVFCEGSGLLKTQYDMSHFELPFSEMGLAKFRNIFDERLEGPKEVLSISCIQYYRLLKLYFTANHEHNGSPEQTDFAVQHVLSNISLQFGLNLIVNRADLEPDEVTSDPLFSVLHGFLANVDTRFGYLASGTRSTETTTEDEVAILPSTLLVFLDDLISGQDCHIGLIPKELLLDGVSDMGVVDRELADTLGCLFSNGILLKFAAFLHLLVSHIGDGGLPETLPRAWASFTVFLEDLITSNSSPRFYSAVKNDERTVTVESVDDEAFYDAAEMTLSTENTSHKYSEPIRECPVCLAALKRLVVLPWSLAIAQISKYIALYQLEAFHRLGIFIFLFLNPEEFFSP